MVDRANLKFEADELALLRSAPLLVRSGRSSFYATILPRSGTYLRFDPNCMDALDKRGRAALDAVRRRLAEAPEQLLDWKDGQIVVIDNWRALHGRAASEAGTGRRLARILVDG
ncbi:TauD/TfdA family dioxygenase [Qipengyuania citrea]|uniref:TauD/TfdA family dioxygenase n=1 Tax=Qipengyuania citrea TaxID=225971 RepID=UPI003298F5E0